MAENEKCYVEVLHTTDAENDHTKVKAANGQDTIQMTQVEVAFNCEENSSLIETKPNTTNENDDVSTAKDGTLLEEKTYVLYKRRWLVLIAYCTLTFAVTATSTAFPAISNILQEFYGVKPIAIHVLLEVYAVSIVLFNGPASFLLHKFELGFVLKLAAALNMTGAIVRYFAYTPSGYYFLLTGNTLSGLSLAAFMFLPPKLAMNWFGKQEAGICNGIAVGSDMFSAALGFIHSTNIVKHTRDETLTSDSVRQVVIHQLVLAGVAFIITFVCVRSHPPSPPTAETELILANHQKAREAKKSKQSENNEREAVNINDSIEMEVMIRPTIEEIHSGGFMASIKLLCKHKEFVVIVHIVTVSATLEYAYSAILNDILIKIYPGKEREIGLIGFSAIILGFVANMVAGAVLDRTRAYKRVTQVIFIVSLMFLIMWTVFLECVHNLVALGIAYCGFVMVSTSYYSVCNTHMVVVTHPLSPGISSMMCMVLSSVYLILLMFLSSLLLQHTRVLYVNIISIAITAAAAYLTVFL